MDYYQPLLSNNCYHILSRAIGNEVMFKEAENYRFFLERYQKYICPIADTFSFNLLENHFHFMVRIKPYEELLPLFKKVKPGNTESDGWQPKFVMKCWSNFLDSYSKSFNKKYNRKGGLFIDYLRRVEVKTDGQFSATIFYVHKNTVHHGFCTTIEEWPWSSYNILLTHEPTFLKREEILNWFDGKERFITYHKQPINLKYAVVVE